MWIKLWSLLPTIKIERFWAGLAAGITGLRYWGFHYWWLRGKYFSLMAKRNIRAAIHWNNLLRANLCSIIALSHFSAWIVDRQKKLGIKVAEFHGRVRPVAIYLNWDKDTVATLFALADLTQWLNARNNCKYCFLRHSVAFAFVPNRHFVTVIVTASLQRISKVPGILFHLAAIIKLERKLLKKM